MNKWYMYTSESVQENKTHKLFWDFEIHMDHLISARRPDFVIVKKKENLKNCGLFCPSRTQSKIEKKAKGKIST